MTSLEGLELLMSYFKVFFFFFLPIPEFLQVGLGWD